VCYNDVIYNKEGIKPMSVKSFKSSLKESLCLESAEIELFDQIPDDIWKNIYKTNFGNNLGLAKNIIWGELDKLKMDDLDQAIQDIHNYTPAVDLIDSYLKAKKQIFFICDIDNDGSSAQASLLEFKKLYKDNTLVSEYWQVINGNDVRGFSYDYVDYLTKSLGVKDTEDFLIVTADNGINSNEEAKKINERFKKAKLLITDHHMPSEEVVVENESTMIFNPKYNPNKYFEKKNISGAHTLTVLLDAIVKRNFPEETTILDNMTSIAHVSNQLDYVNSDIRHKPLKNYMISKFAGLGNVMNVNNSSNQIITGEWKTDVLDKLAKNVKGLNAEIIKSSLKRIKSQNLMAYNLLHIVTDFNNSVLTVEEDLDLASNVYDIVLSRLSKKSPNLKNEVNANFVEQLRPYLINFESKGDKTSFEQAISTAMEGVFQLIKREESTIMTELRKAPIMDVEKNRNSTILMPKDNKILSIFNRKFLTKTYNEENNGFFCVLNRLSPEVFSGSMRSLYDIELMIDNPRAKTFERKHGVKLSYAGHKVAAGFFIHKVKKDVTHETIFALNEFLNKEVEKLKLKDSKNKNSYVVANFDALLLIDKINAKLKSNLPNATAIEPLVKLTKDTYVTDSKTTKQVHIGEMVKNLKYGYKPVNLTFDGKSMILPVEMIKHVVSNGYKDFIEFGYMDEGAFIGKGIKSEELVNPEKTVTIKKNEKGRRDLEKYYIENYKKENGYRVEITEDMIKGLPYFKNNAFGDVEYQRFKNMVISILDTTTADMLAITDTEGTGLGQAPKLFNLGAMNLMVEEKGALFINLDEFEENVFKDFKGLQVFAKEEIREKLDFVTFNDYEKLNFNEKMMIIEDEDQTLWKKPENSEKSFIKVHNKKIKNGKMQINRTIKADMLSLMIKNADIKLPQEIINLTGIDNKLINKVGIIAKKADEIWVKYYEGKNVIFQAHNLPYDNGIIQANMPETTKMFRDSMLSDSAIYSKNHKLAYDNITIGKFKIPELAGLEFYDSLYSEISLTNFLKKDGLDRMPDRTGNYVIKKDHDKIRLIDKRKNTEIEISLENEDYEREINFAIQEDESLQGIELDDLAKLGCLKINDKMNRVSIKYSVEMLSLHESVRNLLLSSVDLDKDIKHPNLPEILSDKPELMHFFMNQYHFDEDIQGNLNNFDKAISMMKTDEDRVYFQDPERREALVILANEFLENNKETVSKFQDVWMYKKVLLNYEPETKTTSDEILTMLAYQTDLPETKIKEILKNSFEYKEKYNLDHIIVHECHNNVVFDREGYGDVVLEGVLTIKRLIDTSYNSYSHQADDPVNIFISNMIETKEKALNSEIGDVALDAFSRKQAATYSRMAKSDKIKEMVKPQRLRFKLGNDILPPGAYIEVEKADKRLTNEEVASLREKIEFIAINRIVENSLTTRSSRKHSVSIDAATEIIAMFESNKAKVEEYKTDIFEILGDHVYFERKKDSMKKISKNIVKALTSGECAFKTKKDIANICLNDIDMLELETFGEKMDLFFQKLGVENTNTEQVENYFTEIEEINDILVDKRKDEMAARIALGDEKSNIVSVLDATKLDIVKWIFKTAPIFMEKTVFELTDSLVIENKRKKKNTP
jgi:hypothetical protein